MWQPLWQPVVCGQLDGFGWAGYLPCLASILTLSHALPVHAQQHSGPTWGLFWAQPVWVLGRWVSGVGGSMALSHRWVTPTLAAILTFFCSRQTQPMMG